MTPINASFDKEAQEWELMKNAIITGGAVTLHVMKASRVPPTDFCTCCLSIIRSGYCDAYVKVSVENDKRKNPFSARTVTIQNHTDPVFSQRFHVTLTDVRSNVLRLELWDKDVFGDELIGYTRIKVWDAIHLIRDDPKIMTMGLDGKMLRIQYRLTSASKKYDIEEHGTSIYVALTAEHNKAILARAQDVMHRQLQANGSPKMDSSLASTNSSPIDSLGHTKPHANRSPREQAAKPQTITVAQRIATSQGRPVTAQSLVKKSIPDSVPALMKNDARIKAEFRKFDIDGNGVIDHTELQLVFDRVQSLGLLEEGHNLRKLCSELGYGVDCKITYPQFAQLMSKVMPLLTADHIPDVLTLADPGADAGQKQKTKAQ
uniref:Calmodulin n=1 Tax=Eutreptiella gymnastica TaxID=73025 RepID=A0A7S1HXK5_9EUGL|mmetsp:Transcript_111833/g.194130  ORF Transcript_111833/g.194130 Transcript_111833/m.194130 type:complete len:375 (+) Transcript_111833:78-1202(+)